MDIANLLESHRKHFIDLLDEESMIDSLGVEHAYDKATVKTLLDLHRTQAPAPADALPDKRGPRPGSKAARDRAKRGAQTRRDNLAKAKLEELKGKVDGAPQMSPATHLAPVRTGE